jgi:hypothetical protein
MSTAAQNQQLFAQAAAIYGQMGMGVPTFTGKPGKGRRTAFLQQVIQQGQSMLNNYRSRQLQDQMRAAQQAARSAPQRSVPRTLQSTLAQADAGVRGRRSRQQLMAQQQGVRAANQLQAGPFIGPQGSPSATPYGSSINLA